MTDFRRERLEGSSATSTRTSWLRVSFSLGGLCSSPVLQRLLYRRLRALCAECTSRRKRSHLHVIGGAVIVTGKTHDVELIDMRALDRGQDPKSWEKKKQVN